MRYRIDGIETIVQTNNLSIEKLIELRNNIDPSLSAELSDTFDMDKIFPIKNDEELIQFESLIQNKEYRILLVKLILCF